MDKVFGVPGGQTLPLHEGISKFQGAIEHVLMRDERSAGYAADAYARMTGKATESYAATVSDEDIRNTIDRNLMGTIYCGQAAAVHMKPKNYGRIVNTSSQAGMRAQHNGNYGSYGVAKAGVISWTQYLAQELGRYNITVNPRSPAYVGTERLMQQSFNGIDDVRKQLKVPLGRLAEPDDIAKVREFFVTDLGDYVTGETISVCGGAINF